MYKNKFWFLKTLIVLLIAEDPRETSQSDDTRLPTTGVCSVAIYPTVIGSTSIDFRLHKYVILSQFAVVQISKHYFFNTMRQQFKFK